MSSVEFRTTVGAPDAEHFIAVHRARAAADGVDPHDPNEYNPDLEGYQEVIASSDPKDWLVAEHEGEVVAYGQALWNWQERDGVVFLHCGFVKPAFRGKGVGTALLEKLELRCREKAETAGHSANLEIAANASGTELAAQELLKNHDYHTAFNRLRMNLASDTVLGEIPVIPDGYELRAVKPEHHPMIWQSIGDAYDARNAENKRFGEAVRKEYYKPYFSGDPSLMFVAWELQSERIAGQVLCTVLDSGDAEVLEVSVGIGHQRKGLGRFLLLNALHELRSRGAKLTTLGTRAENPTEAWRLYERVGFRASKDFLRWRKKRG